MPEDKFRPPFTVHDSGEATWVEDAEGRRFAFTYYDERPFVGTGRELTRHTSDLARLVAKWIARKAAEAAPDDDEA